MEGTAYTTCLLSVTRTIALCRPFYQVNKRAIIFATVTFLSCVTVKHTVLELMYNMSNGNSSSTELNSSSTADQQSPRPCCYTMYNTSYKQDNVNIAQNINIVNNYLLLCTMSLIILLVVISNIMSVIKLLKNKNKLGNKRITEINKRATVTILILSVLFCLFNIVYMLCLTNMTY